MRYPAIAQRYERLWPRVRIAPDGAVVWGDDGLPVENRAIQDRLRGLPQFEGFLNIDVAEVRDPDGFPDFTFYVFDVRTSQRMPLRQRLILATQWTVGRVSGVAPTMLPHAHIYSHAAWGMYMRATKKSENAIARDPNATDYDAPPFTTFDGERKRADAPAVADGTEP